MNFYFMKTVNQIFLIMFFLVAAVYPDVSMASEEPSVIEAIRLESQNNQIHIKLNQKQQYKVVRLNNKTIMIALKNTRITENSPKQLTGNSIIKAVQTENLPGNSAAVEITAHDKLKDVTAFWKDNALVVSITGYRPRHKKRPQRITKSKPKKNKKNIERVKKQSAPIEEDMSIAEYTLPLKKIKNELQGNMDDLPIVLKKDNCSETPAIRTALGYCQKEAFQEAYQVINSFITENPSHACLETASYLRAYCSLKEIEFQDEAKLLETAMSFQDLISYYPESKYTPFGMTALGTIYQKLNNDSEAKGYFNLVLQNFEGFSGIPGVLYELGMIHVKTEKYRKAVVRLEKIVDQYPDVSFIADVRKELGKAYFNVNNFSKSLEQMQWLVKNRPKMVYNNPNLLLYIGNSYYHTGEHEKARSVLTRAYNLYPEVENSHIILTRIADIYVDEGKHEKAKDIYKLVTDKFPGTDGFVISSMRLTEYVKEAENRKDLYMMIINDHPEHPMASLAQLRLAELHYKTKEYDKSIETINRLLEENPKTLKSEANFLKQKSFEAVFKNLFKDNNYPDILIRFEKERRSINRFENPELFFYVGKAYYMGHLYNNAAENLDKAVTLYPDDKKSAELLYLLGTSFFEIDNTKDALRILNRYIKEYPKGENVSPVLLKAGLIQIADKKYADAAKSLQQAMKYSRSDKEKSDILLARAKIHEEQQNFSKATDVLLQAIHLLSASSENNQDEISDSYRRLGHAFLSWNKFDKSADAFAMAVKFLKKDRDSNDLKYLMGIAYQKGNSMGEAEDSFTNVVEAGDPFWSKLAKEKLREINLTSRFET
jgi:TolA-binding protein